MGESVGGKAVAGCLQLARNAGLYPCQSAIDADLLIKTLLADVTKFREMAKERARTKHKAIDELDGLTDDYDALLKRHSLLTAENEVLRDIRDDALNVMVQVGHINGFNWRQLYIRWKKDAYAPASTRQEHPEWRSKCKGCDAPIPTGAKYCGDCYI